jgi:hypothetical protein
MGFEEMLRDEWRARHDRNPRYSLRAFARDLGTDHSSLSQVLRGRRSLSPRMARRFGGRLGVPRAALDEACFELHARAVARLVCARNFCPDSRWIATRTGIPVDAVNVALVRLLRDRTLVMHEADTWLIAGGSHA